MKISSVILFLSICFLSSCTFLANSFKYNDATKIFMDNLVHKDYNKCIGLMAVDNKTAPNDLKSQLDNFSNVVLKNFGDKLEYSFVKAEKKFSTNAEEKMPPNTTLVYVEYKNQEYFGMIQALFDDKTGKILDIKTLNIKEHIPSMTLFWLFGIVAICVPAFVIYMIVLIKQSDMRRKWLKYLFVIVINVPAISYKAVGGISVLYLNFQILLGISFAKEGYLNSYWTFGVPIGGLIILWKLKTNHYKSKKAISESTGPESNLDPDEAAPDI